MSSFQALATAVAAQVGTGNLAGAATAIASGGAGAIFWMWLSAFFGMATIYAEATLGQDRKSTRLNSSHANISYAVFCLKKKKNMSLDGLGLLEPSRVL